MFRLSRKTVFALEAVLDIAYNARAEPVQAREITQRQGIPQRYLEQVMQELVRAGILKGVRGPRGGYHLARERRKVSVGDIVRIVANIENLQSSEQYQTESDLGNKVVKPLLDDLYGSMMERLDNTTLQDLCVAAERQSVERESRSRLDFTI
jgi:Rrf2 family protein